MAVGRDQGAEYMCGHQRWWRTGPGAHAKNKQPSTQATQTTHLILQHLHQIDPRLLQQSVRASGQHARAGAWQRACQALGFSFTGDEEIAVAGNDQHALAHLRA